MPSSITAAMLREAKDFTHRLYPVIEITLAGTVYRFAEEAVCSESAGLYLPYVESIGDRTRTANVAEFTLETPGLRFSINDSERVLQKLCGGPLRGRIRGSLVRIYWRSYGGPENAITAADHFLDFQGKIADYDPSDGIYGFTARADIPALEAPVQIPAWPKEDWPAAPDDTTGSPGRVIYGIHSTAGLTDDVGAIQCVPLKIESNGNVDVWGVSSGAMRATPRVFFDQALATASFSMAMALPSKNYYTVLNYTAGGTHPTKDSDIRCDVDGLTTLPNGSGTVITNPAAQIRHLLANLVFGDGDLRPLAAWKSEAGVPIATAVLDAARDFYDFRAWTGGLVVYSGDKARDVLDEHCKSWNAVPFLNSTWGVGARPRDNYTQTLYHDDRHVAQKLQMALGPLNLGTERQDPITDLNVSYLRVESRAVFAKTHLVAWRRSGVQTVERPFPMNHGRRL